MGHLHAEARNQRLPEVREGRSILRARFSMTRIIIIICVPFSFSFFAPVSSASSVFGRR